MKTLYIDRSTGECRNGDWVDKLDLDVPPDRIVVGTGPGSFAGIRSALAFAQGYALGSHCEVLGLPSACATAANAQSRVPAGKPLAVVGDARQGKIWYAVFRGLELCGEVTQVDQAGLSAAIPAEAVVVTSDEPRIGGWLGSVFGERYLGGALPTAEGLRVFAEASPSALKSEPLPIYLNPAVRN